MERRFSAQPLIISNHANSVPFAGRGMGRLQCGHAGAHHYNMFWAVYPGWLPIMFVNATDPRIVIAFEPTSVDDATPTGIAGDAVTDISLPALLAFSRKGRISDQRASEKYQICRAVTEGCLALVGIRDVTDCTSQYVRSRLTKGCDVGQIRVPLSVRIGQVSIQ